MAGNVLQLCEGRELMFCGFTSLLQFNKDNLDEQNITCINEELLIIGCGLNGDPVVVDLQTLTVGFVFHDELWEDLSVKARSTHIDTGLSVGQFYFYAATQIDTFPVDGYAAEEIYGQT